MILSIAIVLALALAGLLFFYLEFFVPGGILGVAGGVLIVTSAALFFWRFGAVVGSFLYVAALILVCVGTFRLALWKIKKSGARNTFYATGSQEGYQASSFDCAMIGKKGTAVTPLTPAGRIEIEGKWHQAVSEGGYIKKGTSVLVLRGEGARFIVRKE